MRGSSPIRSQGYDDPLLVEVMQAHGYDELPLYAARPPQQQAVRDRWKALGKQRDGPVHLRRHRFDDHRYAADHVKRLAKHLGADDVGIARLTPTMIRAGLDLPHEFVVCMIFAEDFRATCP